MANNWFEIATNQLIIKIIIGIILFSPCIWDITKLSERSKFLLKKNN